MQHPNEKYFTSHEAYSLYKDDFQELLAKGDKRAIICQRQYNERLQRRLEKEKQMADKETIYADGLFVSEKVIKDDFKIIKLGINVEKFMEFLAKYSNDKGYCNIDVKTSKEGKLYAELNTYGLDLTKVNNEVVTFDDMDDEEVPF